MTDKLWEIPEFADVGEGPPTVDALSLTWLVAWAKSGLREVTGASLGLGDELAEGGLLVKVNDKLVERVWNVDSWEETSKQWVESS